MEDEVQRRYMDENLNKNRPPSRQKTPPKALELGELEGVEPLTRAKTSKVRN